jgi:5-formyltetrahydrofolate cyclo-ligase
VKHQKRAVRDQVRQRLADLTGAQRAAGSQRIAERLTALPAWRQAGTVMAFLSLPTEVQTRSIIDRAWAEGKRLVVPKVDWENRRMSAVRINGWSDRLVTGRLGLVEPANDEPTDVSLIDLMLVPGLAFDAEGGRLGRGGGFFDRFMAQPGFRAITCGLAFDCQRGGRLPREVTDLPVDLLVTEAGGVFSDPAGRSLFPITAAQAGSPPEMPFLAAGPNLHRYLVESWNRA